MVPALGEMSSGLRPGWLAKLSARILLIVGTKVLFYKRKVPHESLADENFIASFS